MLKQAVRDLKKGKTPDLDSPLGVNTDIKLHSPALLPETYCPDVHERLVLYKRLAVCETQQQLNEIHEELVDRFGLPETPTQTLLASHKIRLMARELGIDSVDANMNSISLTFNPNTPIEPAKLISLMQKEKNWKMSGADKLRIDVKSETIDERINMIFKKFRQPKFSGSLKNGINSVLFLSQIRQPENVHQFISSQINCCQSGF